MYYLPYLFKKPTTHNIVNFIDHFYVFLCLNTAPTVSVSGFHTTVLNGTTVEATWLLPRSTIGVNGIIRGFKIFIKKVNGSERVISITDVAVRSYIITDLEGFATYVFSMILYNTVADGPKGIHLTQKMPNASEL